LLEPGEDELENDTDLITALIDSLQTQSDDNARIQEQLNTTNGQLQQAIAAQNQMEIDPAYNWLTFWNRWAGDIQWRASNNIDRAKDAEYLYVFIPEMVAGLQQLNSVNGLQFGAQSSLANFPQSLLVLARQPTTDPAAIANFIQNDPILQQFAGALLLTNQLNQDGFLSSRIAENITKLQNDIKNLGKLPQTISAAAIEPLQQKLQTKIALVQAKLVEARRRMQLAQQLVARLPRLIQVMYEL
jgi:hypothetical protein